MFCAVLIKEIVHLRLAAGEQQIMFPNFVINDFEHGSAEICVDYIAHMEFQRFVAVNRNGLG